jgi:hypothetical protein
VRPRINLADAECEPTDEELEELAREAFAHVKADNDAALAKLHREISAARRQLRGA